MKRQARHEVRDEAFSELRKIEGPQEKRGLAHRHATSVVLFGDKTAECSKANSLFNYSPKVIDYGLEGSPRVWKMENREWILAGAPKEDIQAELRGHVSKASFQGLGGRSWHKVPRHIPDIRQF